MKEKEVSKSDHHRKQKQAVNSHLCAPQIKWNLDQGIQLRKQPTDVNGSQTDNISEHVTVGFKTSQITKSIQSKSYQCHGNSNLRNSPNAGKKIIKNQ